MVLLKDIRWTEGKWVNDQSVCVCVSAEEYSSCNVMCIRGEATGWMRQRYSRLSVWEMEAHVLVFRHTQKHTV